MNRHLPFEPQAPPLFLWPPCASCTLYVAGTASLAKYPFTSAALNPFSGVCASSCKPAGPLLEPEALCCCCWAAAAARCVQTFPAEEGCLGGCEGFCCDGEAVVDRFWGVREEELELGFEPRLLLREAVCQALWEGQFRWMNEGG